MRFIVVSGLPGSGKSTLARRLAPALHLPVIDKDDILERLFESKGVGDAQWRRALSRESDEILRREAESVGGAVLVSLWHVPGMPEDSGTPTGWLSDVVHIHCVCAPELAAERFHRRKRHAGHLDSGTAYEAVLAGIGALARLGPLDIGTRIDVDTSRDVTLDDIVRDILDRL